MYTHFFPFIYMFLYFFVHIALTIHVNIKGSFVVELGTV